MKNVITKVIIQKMDEARHTTVKLAKSNCIAL